MLELCIYSLLVALPDTNVSIPLLNTYILGLPSAGYVCRLFSYSVKRYFVLNLLTALSDPVCYSVLIYSSVHQLDFTCFHYLLTCLSLFQDEIAVFGSHSMPVLTPFILISTCGSSKHGLGSGTVEIKRAAMKTEMHHGPLMKPYLFIYLFISLSLSLYISPYTRHK